MTEQELARSLERMGFTDDPTIEPQRVSGWLWHPDHRDTAATLERRPGPHANRWKDGWRAPQAQHGAA